MDWGPMTDISKNHIGMPNTMPWIADNLVACCAEIQDEYSKNEPFKSSGNNKMRIV
jgi:hypothetical protein